VRFATAVDFHHTSARPPLVRVSDESRDYDTASLNGFATEIMVDAKLTTLG
jgi:hypothetical protein